MHSALGGDTFNCHWKLFAHERVIDLSRHADSDQQCCCDRRSLARRIDSEIAISLHAGRHLNECAAGISMRYAPMNLIVLIFEYAFEWES